MPDAPAGPVVPTVGSGWIAADVPIGWTAISTLALNDAGDDLRIVVHCERLDRVVDLDDYADHHESLLAGAGWFDTEAVTTTLLGGQRTRSRFAAWVNADGRAMVTLLACAASDGWGVRSQVTAPHATAMARLPDVVEVLGSVTFPFSDPTAHGPSGIFQD